MVKDRRRRLQAIGEARIISILEEGATESPAQAGSLPHRHSQGMWAVAGVLGVALAALGFVHFREAPPEVRVVHAAPARRR